MTQAFLSSLRKEMSGTALTQNGAISNSTTNSYVLDLFSQIGAFRLGNGAENRLDQFRLAYMEDPLLTLKCLFWARDIRGGARERDTFRILIKDLASQFPGVVCKNLHLIPEYGRWDDLWDLLSIHNLREDIINLIKNQLKNDALSDRPSLLAKWLPSENTSSKETVKMATLIRALLNLSSRDYRKILSSLRTKINIVEKQMSEKKWELINYEHVPAKASMRYRNAFKKNDGTRYSQYIADVASGNKKINSGTLFPYEIVNKFLTDYKADETLEVLWKSLPNFFGDKEQSALVVADVSGSMNGIPIAVAISLAIYIAEKNQGIWKDKFITFSSYPRFNSLIGNTLKQKIDNLHKAHWDMSTDIEKVFDLILNAALENKLDNEDLVKKIFIISDMEFNRANNHRDHKTLFRVINSKFESVGYTLPALVFWNVKSSTVQFPMTLDDTNFEMVSGAAPDILKYMFTSEIANAYDKMIEVLNSDRYKQIQI